MPREDLPEYGGDEAKLKPGLYLGLFHGRKSVDEELDDWGFGGPIIGPLKYVHTTYASELKFQFEGGEAWADFKKYFPEEAARQEEHARTSVYNYSLSTEHNIPVTEDMVCYEGEYFGDWTVFVVGNVMPTAKQMAANLKKGT